MFMVSVKDVVDRLIDSRLAAIGLYNSRKPSTLLTSAQANCGRMNCGSESQGTDIFYLFWCRHAKASKWVEREWRWALESRGLEYIDPVPLEGADAAAPPPELAVKHFNNPLLPYKKGHHG